MTAPVWLMPATGHDFSFESKARLADPACVDVRLPAAYLTSDWFPFARGPVLHQLVAWQGLIDHLLRRLDSGDRQPRGIENANLYQHRRLIPVDMLVVQLIATETDHGEHGNLEVLAGRRQPRKHIVDLAIVRCTEDEFVDDAVRT